MQFNRPIVKSQDNIEFNNTHVDFREEKNINSQIFLHSVISWNSHRFYKIELS